MPSNALSGRKTNPGTPTVCRVPPTPIPYHPIWPGNLALRPTYDSMGPNVPFSGWFFLNIPAAPYGLPCTIDAAFHHFKDPFPEAIYNLQWIYYS